MKVLSTVRQIELLPVSPATMKTILLADQSGLHHTIREMEEEDKVRKELGDLLRQNLMETGGVSVDRFRELLDKRYYEYFKRWDSDQDYPEKNRGINNPYKVGTGKEQRIHSMEGTYLLGFGPRLGQAVLDLFTFHSNMIQAGVDYLEDRTFPTLSGGEKQRVQFARMLAQLWNRIENRMSCCLLLDEPISSLDLAHQHSIMHLVSKLSRKNVAVLMILHDLNLAAQYADEVNVMKDGRTYALGTPNDVFKPEIIEMAFDCPVHIMRHPHHHCPLVVAGSGAKKVFYSV